MRLLSSSLFVAGVLAARPFLNEADTGLEDILGNLTAGDLPSIDHMVALPDFDYAARLYLPAKNYSYYRGGASGEYCMSNIFLGSISKLVTNDCVTHPAYRNNLEVFHRLRLKPRVLGDVSGLKNTLSYVVILHAHHHLTLNPVQH